MIKKPLLIPFCLSGTILLFFLNKATLCRNQPDNWMRVLTPPNQVSVLHENIHFVVQTEDLDMANIKLKVTHNNLFLKEISPNPGYTYFGKHYRGVKINNHPILYKIDNSGGLVKIAMTGFAMKTNLPDQ